MPAAIALARSFCPVVFVCVWGCFGCCCCCCLFVLLVCLPRLLAFVPPVASFRCAVPSGVGLLSGAGVLSSVLRGFGCLLSALCARLPGSLSLFVSCACGFGFLFLRRCCLPLLLAALFWFSWLLRLGVVLPRCCLGVLLFLSLLLAALFVLAVEAFFFWLFCVSK